MHLRIHPQADRELEVAGDELGQPFLDTVEAVLDRALMTPGAGVRWPGLGGDINVRRRALPHVKHLSLAYTPFRDTLWLVAVVHDRRRPLCWLERLDDLAK